MKTKELKQNMSHLARFIAARPTLPILECVHVKRLNGYLEMTVYDMNKSLSIMSGYDSEPAHDFDVCVDFKNLRKVINGVKADMIQLSCDADKLVIKGGGIEFRLQTKPGSEYPKMPDAADCDPFGEFNFEHFRDETNFVIAATEIKSTTDRYIGLLLFDMQRESGCTIVGTDTQRMHTSTLHGSLCNHEMDFACLVPSSAIQAIGKLKCDSDATILIKFSDVLMHWSISNAQIEGTIGLVDTPYPDYEKVTPEKCECHFTIDKKDTLEALGALAVIANARDGRDMVVITANGELNLEVRSEEMGVARAVVDCDQEQGDEARFALNINYMMEALKLSELDDVCMRKDASPLVPIKFTYPGTERIAVVMPVRLPE